MVRQLMHSCTWVCMHICIAHLSINVDIIIALHFLARKQVILFHIALFLHLNISHSDSFFLRKRTFVIKLFELD